MMSTQPLARAIKDQSDRAIWHRMASAIGPDEALAAELDDTAARSQRRGALGTAIIALENAAQLSGTTLSKSERLLRAAGFAADMGQPAMVERLLHKADMCRSRICGHASPGFAKSASR